MFNFGIDSEFDALILLCLVIDFVDKLKILDYAYSRFRLYVD